MTDNKKLHKSYFNCKIAIKCLNFKTSFHYQKLSLFNNIFTIHVLHLINAYERFTSFHLTKTVQKDKMHKADRADIIL